MRKKLFRLLLSGALALGLAACAPAGDEPGPSPSPAIPPPDASVPVLETPEPSPEPSPSPEFSPSPEPSAPPGFGADLPDRDYQPWQTGYMDFLSGLARADLESRERTTEAGEYYWPAYEGLAEDRRGVFCLDAGEKLRMTQVMAMGGESYSLRDVDRDGVPELFVKYGSCEAAFTYQCYTFRDGQVLCIGEFDGGHSSLYAHPDKNALLRSEGHMGYHEVYECPMEGGALTQEREIFSEEDVREYTPTEEIVPGAEYIEYFYTWRGAQDRSYFTGEAPYSLGKALLLPVCDHGVGPAATGDSSETARTAILAALNGEMEVYGASGDHFYGDTGPIAWDAYIQPHGAYPYNDVPLEVTAHAWQDMNGDGQEECLLRLWWPGYGEGGGYAVVLSEQEGAVYAYFFGFYDQSEFRTDGTVTNTYDGTVKLSFWKGQCYQYAVPETSAPPLKWADGAPAG